MGDINTKSRLERFIARIKLDNVIVAVVVFAMCVWVWATIVALDKNYDLEKQVQQGRLENEIQEIENENLRLQQVYYQTNEYLELSAREKLNKTLPGEHLIILPKTESVKKVDTGVAAVGVDDRSNLEKWVEFLLGVKR